MADNKTPKISIGITSMTVIMCVLCLTVFSVLTLSTALSERDFSKTRAAATREYYDAESDASTLINKMYTTWKNGGDLKTFSAHNEIEVEGDNYCFQKKIDDGQALHVVVRFKDDMEIINWQVVSTGEWTPDDSLEVWDGTF